MVLIKLQLHCNHKFLQILREQITSLTILLRINPQVKNININQYTHSESIYDCKFQNYFIIYYYWNYWIIATIWIIAKYISLLI